jgi:hypothetical protein
MKKLLLSVFALTAFGFAANAQVLYTEEFNKALTKDSVKNDAKELVGIDSIYAWSYRCAKNLDYKLSKPTASELTLNLSGVGGLNQWGECFGFMFYNADGSDDTLISLAGKNPYVTIKLKSDFDFNLVIGVGDVNDYGTDKAGISLPVTGDGTYKTLTYQFKNSDWINWQDNKVDSSKIAKFWIAPNKGTGAAAVGNVTFDSFVLGVEQTLATAAASELASSVTVTPNPASEVATVSYNANSSNVVVKVTDLAGSVVKTVNGSSSAAVINTNDLSTGLYMVTVVVDGSAVKTERLFVK